MKKLFTIFFLCSAVLTFGQVPDSLKHKWIPSLVAGFGINQIAFSNWTKGGESSIAWTAWEDFHFDRTGTTWVFKNQIKAIYGRSKIGSSTYRTTDNDLYIENVVIQDMGWFVNPFISNSIRTQIANGFDYTVSPEFEVANFFDPAYVTQTVGYLYEKYPNIITRLGVGFQEIFTNKFRRYSDDPVTTDKLEAFKFETGIESVTDINYKIGDNLIYTCKLRLFSQFKSLDVWDVRWDNMIRANISKIISVNFTYLLIYEKAQSPYTQTKEGLQLGITYKVF